MPRERSLLRTIEDVYARLRLLSIDVALAALGGGVMASRLSDGRPSAAFYLLLPLAVWVVYTLDHLMDAARVGMAASTPRHRFHFQYATALTVPAMVLGIVCIAGGLLWLRPTTLLCGGAVAVLFGLHELLVKLAGGRVSVFLTKELGVAAIFTAGTWGVPLAAALAAHRDLRPVILPAAQYLLLALANLLILSIFEARADARAGQSSFVQAIGRRRATILCEAALAIALILGVPALLLDSTHGQWLAQGIYLAMTIGLSLITRFPQKLARRERYRSLGDGVFLLPLLMAAVR